MKPRKTRIATALAAMLAAPALPSAWAQEAAASQSGNPDGEPATQLDTMVVTATRRAVSLQQVPINISAVSAAQVDELQLEDITDLTRFVPGVTQIDMGPRTTSGIIIRGLNANNIASSDTGAVATYLGETPLFVDFKLLDIDRVEVLKGPQGTLYGAGTLAGSVRYLPNKPVLGQYSSEFTASAYNLTQAQDTGFQGKATVNLPIGTSERYALRVAAGWYDDPGFIDYPWVANNPGVTSPITDVHRVKDANYERTFSSRTSLLGQITDNVEATLTWMHQNTKTDGQQYQQVASAGTGKYEAGRKVAEPYERSADLLNLEVHADLGFAELVSSTSYARTSVDQVRDQTPLLLDFEYGYEDFPNFVGTSTDHESHKQWTQELRLVSQNDGPLNWVVGGFYNKYDETYHAEENIPGFSKWAQDQGWSWITYRADDLEYWNDQKTKFDEKAVFGEIGYEFTDAWQVTLGGRYFRYSQTVTNATDLPLLNETTALDPTTTSASTDDSGSVFKFNTSYKFSDDIMAYYTWSQGYRIGGVNTVAACQLPLEAGKQYVCALPDELYYEPDKTTNNELGVRTSWFGGYLKVNAAIFHIDWDDVQVASTTTYGSVGITGNGAAAVSKGGELSFEAYLPAGFSLSGNYSYTDAYLTTYSPGLLSDYYGDCDGYPGDRLPGTPKQTLSMALNWTYQTARDYELTANYAVTAQGDVYTKVGNRCSGEVLGGYAVHQASFGVGKDNWRVSLYAHNLFNKYAITSVTLDTSYIRTVGSNDFDTRRYAQTVLRPREVGVEFNVKF